MSHLIVVSNLYSAARTVDVELMFAPFGEVVAAGLLPREAPGPAGRRAWVEMLTPADVAAAVAALDGTAHRGRVIGCAASRPSDGPAPGGFGDRGGK